jgi:hypothetical protein
MPRVKRGRAARPVYRLQIVQGLEQRQINRNRGALKMEVELCEFTKQEAEWLCDLVQEKLIDMGYESEGFAFNINVELPEED